MTQVDKSKGESTGAPGPCFPPYPHPEYFLPVYCEGAPSPGTEEATMKSQSHIICPPHPCKEEQQERNILTRRLTFRLASAFPSPPTSSLETGDPLGVVSPVLLFPYQQSE